MDLRFLDPNGQPTREAFNERFSRLNDLTNNVGNEYVWAKQQTGVVPVAGTSSYTGMNFNNYVRVSSSVTISNGVITQVSPTEILIKSASDLQNVVGKYVWAKVFTNSAYNNVITYAPNVALSGSTIMLQNIEIGSVVLGYVNSPDPAAYPPAVSDGATYTPLGQLGEKVRLATGSYVGTGKTGSGNINNITFPFEPKLVIISRVEGLNPSSGFWQHSAIWHKGNTKVIVQSSELNVTATENTISFYTTNTNAYAQLNGPGETYYYIAIG